MYHGMQPRLTFVVRFACLRYRGIVICYLIIISSSCKMADQRVGMKRSHNVDDADSPETKKLNLQEGTYTLY